MSDIPIGSPPVPPGRHAAPSGWYPDPVDPLQERYWDGWQWSRTTRLRNDIGSDVESQFRRGRVEADAGQPPAGQLPATRVPAGGPPTRGPAALGGMPQATQTADGVPLAGWWWRALAVYLDSMLVGLLGLIAGFSIYRRIFDALQVWSMEVQQAAREGRTELPPMPADLLSRSDQLMLTITQLVVALLYQIIFLRWRAATPGKLICRLRVVPLDQGRSSEPLSWGSVIRRALVWVVPSVSVYLLLVRLLDVVLPLWHPKRQALHDLAAHTQVVRPR